MLSRSECVNKWSPMIEGLDAAAAERMAVAIEREIKWIIAASGDNAVTPELRPFLTMIMPVVRLVASAAGLDWTTEQVQQALDSALELVVEQTESSLSVGDPAWQSYAPGLAARMRASFTE